VRDNVLRLEAQVCSLPYRGFAIREALASPTNADVLTPRRMQFGDTADFGNLRYEEFCHSPAAFRVFVYLVRFR
jgi:hypothetical protein